MSPANPANPGTTAEPPRWRPDDLVGYEQIDLVLRAVSVPAEPPMPLVATLVRRTDVGHRRAVLYVHGWADYFFQTHLGDFFADRGVDFYALDLRRYGRSLRTGLYAGYVDDLADYDEELDLAVSMIVADGHERVFLMGHSTGGLIATLHAGRRPGVYAALLLNAPWLAAAADPWRQAVIPLVEGIAYVRPTAILPPTGEGHYARSVWSGEDGEWDYDRSRKAHPAFLARAGWLRAVLAGQREIAAHAVQVDCPVLCATSDRSWFAHDYDSEAAHQSDAVLDVALISDAAAQLSAHVTLVRIPGGMHDLALSRSGPREKFFGELGRWLDAYAAD